MPQTIVSFTSTKERVPYIEPMINSITQQSYAADQIFLWLPYSMQNEKLPSFLSHLEIKFLQTLKKELGRGKCFFTINKIGNYDQILFQPFK